MIRQPARGKQGKSVEAAPCLAAWWRASWKVALHDKQRSCPSLADDDADSQTDRQSASLLMPWIWLRNNPMRRAMPVNDAWVSMSCWKHRR